MAFFKKNEDYLKISKSFWKVVLALGIASGQYNLHWAIMTNLGHITSPL
jgi:hypothetical protein